jgi:hypothetical protein
MAITRYSYNVPPAGGGPYDAPTPHAAAVAQEPFTAPESDLMIPDLSPKLGAAREAESGSPGD